MPDLKRVCLAAAAVVLLAAIAGGQQASPFRQPPRMPPEITPGHGAPPLQPAPRVTVDLDNPQLRVLRYRVQPGGVVNLPNSSSGELIVALTGSELRTTTGLDLRTSTATVLRAGENRWIQQPSRILNPGTRTVEFLLIQPKRN
jgi:hypothetical protein